MKILTNKSLIFIAIFTMNLFTGCEKEKKVVEPVLTTTSVSNITAISAVSGGNITNDGGATVTARGVCWSTGITPTISDNKTTDGAGAGSFLSNISGIYGGTVYYVRAYATNSKGTGYGMAMSFTTTGEPPSAPIATATNATQVQLNSATLNGIVNAKYHSTSVTFEYGTTLSYGQTITATQSPVIGGTNTNVNASLTGLTIGTTYHYRVKAVNSLGTTNSNDITFTTLGQAPTATTQSASNINVSSATLNGTSNPNWASTIITFEYGTTTSYGFSILALQSPLTGNETKIVTANITGLKEGTTYHYRIKAENSLGTFYGNDMTLTTLGQIPTVITQDALNITISSASLIGSVNANYLLTSIIFEYGIDNNYGNSIVPSQSPVSGNTNIPVSVNISNLAGGTTYHYRVKAVNSLGTSYGNDLTFKTLGQVPTASTQAASNIQLNSITLNGIVNANYFASDVTFEYGTDTNYGNSIVPSQSPVSGNTNIPVSVNISNLAGGTTYHYRVKAVNSLGTSYGNDLTFKTLGQEPTASTQAASNIQLNSATLNGIVNANYFTSDVTFEYGSDTNYGNSIVSSQSPVSGNTNIPVSVIISNLAGGTAYHYRVKAVNSLGTSYGNDLTFKTLGQEPTASTQAASNIQLNSATLNGIVNANYFTSDITFEYGTDTNYGNSIVPSQSPVSGSIDTHVNISISNLSEGTTYHYRIKGVNSIGIGYSSDITFTTLSKVADNIGNLYKIIRIGNQIWFSENLKTTKFNNGTSIPLITDNTEWANHSPAFSYYNNDKTTYGNVYGALYNYYAVQTGLLCPVGWHVPSKDDWSELETFLGGADIAGGKLKESGMDHWASPNQGATNESGFTALPGGIRLYHGPFNLINYNGRYWSSTEYSSYQSWHTILGNTQSGSFSNYIDMNHGCSIRCIKDN